MKVPRDEEDDGWGEYISKLFAEATYAAHLRAMETMGYVIIARDGYLIKLYPDDIYETLKKL